MYGGIRDSASQLWYRLWYDLRLLYALLTPVITVRLTVTKSELGFTTCVTVCYCSVTVWYGLVLSRQTDQDQPFHDHKSCTIIVPSVVPLASSCCWVVIVLGLMNDSYSSLRDIKLTTYSHAELGN